MVTMSVSMSSVEMRISRRASSMDGMDDGSAIEYDIGGSPDSLSMLLILVLFSSFLLLYGCISWRVAEIDLASSSLSLCLKESVRAGGEGCLMDNSERSARSLFIILVLFCTDRKRIVLRFLAFENHSTSSEYVFEGVDIDLRSKDEIFFLIFRF